MDATALLATMIRSATPLAFAALGGMFSERSGVVNIGLEGLMLLAAFAGVVGSFLSGSALVGLALGLAVGVVGALVHAVATITLEADQIISGTAINLLALGGTGLMMEVVFGAGGTTPRVAGFSAVALPGLSSLPLVGPALFDQSVLVYVLYLTVPVCLYVLYRTRFGLRLRATGELPAAVDAAGLSVVRMRYAGVALSGLLAGMGGVYLSMGVLSIFVEGMTGGRGFIALAALIFGRWNPVRAVAATLLFGLADAFVIRDVIASVPDQFVAMLPYLLTIVALAAFGGRAVAPAALGTPYRKE